MQLWPSSREEHRRLLPPSWTSSSSETVSSASIHPSDLSLQSARALIERAIDKAEEIGMRGAIVVVGASGTLISASRMDRGGAGGMARARSKAWIAATQQIPSLTHLKRMGIVAPPMVTGFVICSPEAVFPGAGGMPIYDDEGRVIAGLAASGAAIGPFVDYPGADPQKLIAGGRPANGEDLLVHYALGLDYEGQHGDDDERWAAAYGPFPSDAGPGAGMDDPPPAVGQRERAWALELADRAMAEAGARETTVAVSIVDRRGEPIQQDLMDGGPSAAVEVSQATAAAASTCACPSGELTERLGGPAAVAQLGAALPFAILAVPGAVPILQDGVVVGAIGIGGPAPELSAAIAAAARDAVGP
jgi:uncharacterized protein GlcG (DUF336 family)